jgi:hypothetical protein
MTLGSTQPLTEMTTRNLPIICAKWRLARKADNLTAICEPIFWKMWESQRLTTLWASTACYRARFTFCPFFISRLIFNFISHFHFSTFFAANLSTFQIWHFLNRHFSRPIDVKNFFWNTAQIISLKYKSKNKVSTVKFVLWFLSCHRSFREMSLSNDEIYLPSFIGTGIIMSL